MGDPLPQPNGRYTWTDYRAWDDDQRWEIIGGEAYLMASPTTRHQRIVRDLALPLDRHLRGQPCELFISPMDVRLSEQDVVQPDLMIVCDRQQITRTHIEGAPPLVVEIVSGSSGWRDRSLKLELYARAGVREYWLVTPWPATIEVLVLQGHRYLVEKGYPKEATLVSPTFPGLEVVLADVFDFPLEPGEDPPLVKEPPGKAYRTPA